MTLSTRSMWLKHFNAREDFPFKYLDNAASFCKICEKAFGATEKSQFQQHLKSERHNENAQLKLKRSLSQAQLEDLFLEQGETKEDQVRYPQ